MNSTESATGLDPTPALIIVPDTSPLILLAAGEALSLLQAMGRVVVPDVIRLEATRLMDKPFAPEIAAWLTMRSVEIAETEMGGLYQLAVELGRRPPRHAGELAIVEWLAETLTARQIPTLVVADDLGVPSRLAHDSVPGTVGIVTTRALLDVAQENSLIESAEVLWSQIEAKLPTANPFSIRRNLLQP